nr:hypothetical protein [Wolbachia pipientis]
MSSQCLGIQLYECCDIRAIFYQFLPKRMSSQCLTTWIQKT